MSTFPQVNPTYTAGRIVLSLYDLTGEAVRPWAEHGYECHIFDIQPPEDSRRMTVGKLGGSITTHHADLHSLATIRRIHAMFEGEGVVFLSAFPVCTDLAVSGARHFEAKAATYATWCGMLGEMLCVPYYVENPVSRLATLWRKPDHRFDPCDFGGFIPEDQADHPRWPEYIAPRDAYTKRTCLWTGNGFRMPLPDRVEPITVSYIKADGTVTTGSQQFGKLGGKSQRTKDIRSATPRGFALAVFYANEPIQNRIDRLLAKAAA